MAALNIGDKAPHFCLPDYQNHEHCLDKYSGRWVAVYFYPRDNTPGCTTEACEFSERYEALDQLDCTVIGISPDSAKSHGKFIDKFILKHILLCDENHETISAYGQWVVKKMYGKEIEGVNRSTFLINPEGKIAYIWNKVKAQGHAEEVKQKLSELKKTL